MTSVKMCTCGECSGSTRENLENYAHETQFFATNCLKSGARNLPTNHVNLVVENNVLPQLARDLSCPESQLPI